MKKKSSKTSPAYSQGANDANVLVKLGLSVWALCSLSHAWGFRRKTPNSNKKLFRYCEGFCDVIETLAKKKGIKIKTNEYGAGDIDQEDIGKEV